MHHNQIANSENFTEFASYILALEKHINRKKCTIKLNKYKDEHQRHSTNKNNKQNRIDFLGNWLNDCR